MLLLPPQEAESQQPLYRITVELDLNPFLPLSYITRVFRCGVDDGELVGKFGFAYSFDTFRRLQYTERVALGWLAAAHQVCYR
jgi:hypothetical protein